jgi:serine/threonine-protein kinase haspin
LNDSKSVEYIQPLLVEGGSNEVLDFKAWANRLSKRFKIVKLAEGSFGEVFKLAEKDIGHTTVPVLDAYGGCIMKVVPLNAKSGPGSKKYSTVAEVVREVKLLKTMDKVPGFTRFRKVHVVQGKYPGSFLEAFRDFREEGRDCENQDPEHFPSKQLFAVIEMDDAGADLESLRKPSVFQVHDIFWSIVVLLANAEEQVEFEHRDLHVGNICIKPGVAGGMIEIPGELASNMVATPKSLLGLSGLRTTIIDYTLSRAASGPEKADVIFDPFKDASMFKAVGRNPEDKRQFETYRSMHSCVVAAHVSPRKACKGLSKLGKNVDIWSRFVPQTNVVWLSYILHVLLFRADARIVPNSNEVAEKLQVQMYDTLEDVMDRLNVDSKALPMSAKDLVCIAEANGWLTGEDLRGLKERLEAEQEE